MRRILLKKLSNYLEEQNNKVLPNLSEISLSDYSRLKYDEFLELVRYCRYLLEIDITGNISEILGKQLLEYQNKFVNHLMEAESIEHVNVFYGIYNQIILSLFNDNKDK